LHRLFTIVPHEERSNESKGTTWNCVQNAIARASDGLDFGPLLMKVHAIEAGRLLGNKRTATATGWSSVLHPREDFECPAYVYIIERADGHIAIDTGLNSHGWKMPLLTRRIAPYPIIRGQEEEIGPRMRAVGLAPEDVRTVILTHLDTDHVGGLTWFPNAEVLVHRPEYEYAATFFGKIRYQPELWPAQFSPTLYDLDSLPCGPFPRSKVIGGEGDLRLVPIPGHSIGQVGAILQTNEVALFFTADHVLRQDWFIEDWGAGRLYGVFGALFYPKLAIETTRRIHRFVSEASAVVLPAHDTDAPRRLAAMEPIRI
jgi:N-acyl homoserine lactone hydrolase